MRKLIDIVYNFHWVIPREAARSSQAYFGRLGKLLDRHGIRAVINMRGRNTHFRWWHYERDVCKRRGIGHFDCSLNTRSLPTRTMLIRLFEAFDTAERPILIKCAAGQDRTSLGAALFILHRDGWDALDRADAQFSRYPYRHLPQKTQRWMRQLIQFAREDAEGKNLLSWIGQDYEPERFAAWLNANGYTGSFRGIHRENDEQQYSQSP